MYLKGPFVYDIKSSCLIGSKTELTGDSTAKLKLAKHVGWTKIAAGTPIIGQMGSIGSAVHDIKIHGFEIDGNEGAQLGSGGKDLYRLISFQGSSKAPVHDISVYNMYLHDAKGDGFRCTYGKNIYYYNNVGSNLQSTCVKYSRVIDGEIHDNVAHQCASAADRLDSCQNITIMYESISPYVGDTTYPKNSKGCTISDRGVLISNIASSALTKNIIVRNCNIMSGVNGIQLDSLNDGSNVNINGNIIHDCGYEHESVTRNGGIAISSCGNGITISKNEIIGSYVAGININSAVPGIRYVNISLNKIMNGKTGYAIKNSVPKNVKLVLNRNTISGYQNQFYPPSIVNPNPVVPPVNPPVIPK